MAVPPQCAAAMCRPGRQSAERAHSFCLWDELAMRAPARRTIASATTMVQCARSFLRGDDYETSGMVFDRDGRLYRRGIAGMVCRTGSRADHADDFCRRHAGGAVPASERA